MWTGAIMFGRLEPVLSGLSLHSLQLRLRRNESKRRPASGAHRPLEPPFRTGGVGAQQEPVAKTVAQGGERDVRGVGRRDDLVRSDLSPIETQSYVVEISARRTGAVAVEHGLSLGAAAGPHQRHPGPIDRPRALSRIGR